MIIPIARLASAYVCAMLCLSPPLRVAQFRVIDGDTLAVDEQRIRLIGFDAPEMRTAKCPGEQMLAGAAKLRMQMMVASPERVSLVLSGRRDRWGRELGTLKVGGEDVAAVMIREGLAHPYAGRGKRQGWCHG